MFNFSAKFLLLVFSISATLPAEGKDCWCNKKEVPSDEKKVILEFVNPQEELEEAMKHVQFSDSTEKTEFIQNTLEMLASRIQQPVQELLNILNIPWVSYWIANVITIAESDYEKIKGKLKGFKIIKDARPEEMFQMSDDDVAINNQETVIEAANHTLDCPPKKNQLTWGLNTLKVREAWKTAKGRGIVIGSIDTGVRVTHKAIKSKYVNSTHSWYDPKDKSKVPKDKDGEGGHGTHTVGTMLGDFGIGVAPSARFIACCGCDAETCRESWLLECGQFMLCPTKTDGTGKDCSLAPRIVNNSWGSQSGVLTKWYLSTIQTWIKADIIPVFAIGNSGPKCNTTASPGNYVEAIGVGASDSNDMIGIFSSRGPAPENKKRFKPDITAPGVETCSASADGDGLYIMFEGTSMAAPHISGIIALMLSVNPKRITTYQEVKSILYSRLSLQNTGLKTNDGKWTCNKDLPKNKPNDPQRHDNYFGRGISIASKAVKTTKDWFKTHPK